LANLRAIKVAAFQDLPTVLLRELHAGAKLSAAAAATEVRVPPGPNVRVRVLQPSTQHETSTFPLDAASFAVCGTRVEGPAALHDVALNGVSATAGDILLRLDRRDRFTGIFMPELEVLACCHRLANVSAIAFDTELDKALGRCCSTSFFLLVTTARVVVDFDAPISDAEEDENCAGGSGSDAAPASGLHTRSMMVRYRRISLWWWGRRSHVTLQWGVVQVMAADVQVGLRRDNITGCCLAVPPFSAALAAYPVADTALCWQDICVAYCGESREAVRKPMPYPDLKHNPSRASESSGPLGGD
jgi:hypothetical protein